MTRRKLLVVAAALALAGAACGQKPNVARVGTETASGNADLGGVAPGGSGGGPEQTTTTLLDGGTVPGGGGSGATLPGAPGRSGAGSGGSAATAPTGGASGGGGGGGAPAGPGDRTGISESEIVIGIHAPVTGAAPFPQSSFEAGKDVYWKFLNEKGGVYGRRVRVVFEDDKFDPRSAVQVCKKMVEQDKAFLLVGGGGADQITACARYANTVGVPYLSAGVNEDGLAGLRGYFAVSMTYSQQSPLLAQMIAKQFPGKKVGIAVADSGSFDDAQRSITREAQAKGLQVVYNKRIPKSASQTQALSIANELRTAGAEVVYFLSSPTTFLNVAAAGAGQGYRPQYVGPGITSGLNTVATVGCGAANSVDRARFFSPFPQLDVIDQMDPDYRPAYRKYAGGNPDDIGIALWGLNKTLAQMFLAAGKDMSRQSFVATLESGRPFASGVYPPVQYSPRNHFGSNQTHVLQADCASRTYKTIARFVSGF